MSQISGTTVTNSKSVSWAAGDGPATAAPIDSTPDLPTIGGFVQLPQAWHSSAGVIQNLVEHAVGGVGIITSRKGATRAGHWHREDWHYLCVVSGLIQYEEWDPEKIHPDLSHIVISAYTLNPNPETKEGFNNLPDVTRLTVGPGQMIFTPPLRAHRVTFIEDTVMVSISKLSRTKAEHERDVVRL